MSVEKMRAFIIRFLFYGLILALIFVALKYVFPFLMPFLMAFFIAWMLKPLTNKITQKTKLKRSMVAVGLLVVFYVLLVTLLIVLGTRLVLGAANLFEQLPDFYNNTIQPSLLAVQDKITDLPGNFDPALETVIGNLTDSFIAGFGGAVQTISTAVINWAGGFAMRVPNFFVQLLFTIVASFFFVSDYYKVTGFLCKQMPPKALQMLYKIKEKGIDVLLKFGRAYALLMLLTFAELSVGLMLLGVPYAVLWALLIALVDILPVLGTGTVLIPWSVISFILGNLPMGIGLLVMYAIITVVRQMLEPRVVGKQIGLYPLVTLMCMFVGAQLFGFIGLLGLPVAVTVLVQLNRSGDIHIFKN